MPTKLQFDQTHSITVDEDLDAVESAFSTAPSAAAPIVQLTFKGDKVFVNVALVRAFAEVRERSAKAHFV